MCKPVPETDVSVDPSEYSTPLQLHVTRRSGRLVLTVVGEVDMTTAPRLAQALTECLDQHPEELQLVRLGTLLDIDPELRQVADLPLGWLATRASPTDAWVYGEEPR